MQSSSALSLNRERHLILPSLAVISGLAWGYLFILTSGHDPGPLLSGHHAGHAAPAMTMTMPMAMAWGGREFGSTFVMWTVMMVAMMVPSAVPVILTYARIEEERSGAEKLFLSTLHFVLGYLAVWTGFSLLATVAQWGLHQTALLSPVMGRVNPGVGGVILLAAGVFQLTSVKHACLHHHREPRRFLLSNRRVGKRSGFTLGLAHGVYCTVTCGMWMAVMFVVGVMNMVWMALITGLIVIEKSAPGGDWVGRVAGVLLSAWGLLLLGSALHYAL